MMQEGGKEIFVINNRRYKSTTEEGVTKGGLPNHTEDIPQGRSGGKIYAVSYSCGLLFLGCAFHGLYFILFYTRTFPQLGNTVLVSDLRNGSLCKCKKDSANPCGSNRCTCRKFGLNCMAACGECRGEDCLNSKSREIEDEEEQSANFYIYTFITGRLNKRLNKS